jgi:N,N-dimethylformamidase
VKLAPDFGITGYTDRWTYRPGEEVSLHLSASRAGKAEIRLHRFRRLEPDGGGLELVADLVPKVGAVAMVQPRTTRLGSWLTIEDGGRLGGPGGFSLACLLQPTRIGPRPKAVLAQATAAAGLVLVLRPDRALELVCRAGDGREARLALPAALATGVWSALLLTVDPEAGELRLAVESDGRRRRAEAPLAFPPRDQRVPFTFAAAHDSFMGGLEGFDGRLEAPMLWGRALEVGHALAQLERFAGGDLPPDPSLVAAWDFSEGIDGDTASDMGPNGLDGRFVNLPLRAVKGRGWSGAEQSWRHALRDYAAVHFHSDDLGDAGWPASATLALPPDLASGCYLVEVAGEAGCDTLPIFVTAARPGAAARLAWLAPTFTYLAYVNDRCLLHGANPEVLADRLLVLTRGDVELAAHPEYGLSLYDTHADGTGVALASRRRPCLTFRHAQRAWQGGLGASLWNFPADLLILSWLDEQGLECEIVTDDDLDRDGPGALAPYRCVLTGGHPEYHTDRSLDAVEGFLEQGGRLVYLGGNGFYWRVATHVDFPGVIELRRAEDGNRSWAADPGEYYHAFDGAYGGLWRRNGRPPQALVGVGYTAQGFRRSHPYRWALAVRDPRVAFLFDQPPEPGDVLGDFGLLGGGAAGIEIDRADPGLGTPPHALVLASATGLDDSYVLANEEVLVNRPTVTGSLSPLVRADLVFFETRAGGAVLATGSIAWAGSMADPRRPNPVAELTLRAIDRLLDPAPFTPPGDAP